MSVISDLKIHLQGISSGDRLSDRIAIGLLVFLRGLAPLWRLLDRIRIRIPSPLRLVSRYRIRDGVCRWEVKGTEGAAYLFPRTDLGTALEEIEQGLTGVCIDVGASFGWYTVRWARQLETHGRVIALEPHPRHYPSLITNVALNGLSNVVALRCAAGDIDGTLTLYDPAFGISAFDASAVRNQGGVAVEVPVRRIDSLCEELSLDDVRLVKIDVEGFEPQVLRGMTRLLQGDRPTVVFEAWTPEALSACRAEFPTRYTIRRLNDWDYVAEATAT
jgi:FkbM family methyltransferase